MEIKIVPIEESHIPELWNIVRDCPNFFADNLKLDKYEDFCNYLINEVTGVLVGTRGDEVLGCAYLENLDTEKGFGCIALISKRRSVTPSDMLSVLKTNISHYFKKYNLNMIYIVTRTTNKAVFRLIKALGFSGLQFLKNYQKVNGEWTDYVLAGIIKEKIRELS